MRDLTGGRGSRLLAVASFDALADDALRTVVPLMAVGLVGATGVWVGVLNALPFAWFLLAAAPIGRMVDQRPWLSAMTGVAIRLVVSGGFLGLFLSRYLTTWALAIVVLLVGLGDAIFTTAHSVLVPKAVGVDGTASLYRRIEAVGSIARLVGPALVAWLLSAAGFGPALAMVALAYLVNLALLLTLRQTGETSGAAMTGTSNGAQHRLPSGPWGILRLPGLGELTAATTLMNASAMFSGAALVFLMLDRLSFSPAVAAMVGVAGAAGGLAGAVAVGAFTALSTGTSKLVCAAGCAVSSAFVPLAVLAPTRGAALSIVLAGEFLTALWMTSASIVGADAPARVVPQNLLGSAFAAMRFLTIGVMPVASILGGLAVSAAGAVATLALGSVICASACGVLWRIRGWSPPR